MRLSAIIRSALTLLATFAVALPPTVAMAEDALAQTAGAQTAMAQNAGDGASVERGRYLARIGGCNDCHTAGYGPSQGTLPEAQWLMGNPVGYRGPWGTDYAVNLRLYMAARDEDEWAKTAHSFQARPPMPWFNMHYMPEADTRSLYRFIRSLGPGGVPMPEALPPGVEPKTAYNVAAPPVMPK
jgi:mono/diheme cytochrome c family protein